MHRKKFLISIGIVISLLVLCGVFFVLSIQSNKSSTSENKPAEAKIGAYEKIAEICEKSIETTNYKNDLKPSPGEVIVFFDRTASGKEIKRYLEENHFKLSIRTDADKSLNAPTPIIPYWNNELFSQLEVITIEEINAFLGKLRADPAIKRVVLSKGWSSNKEGNIERIDRLGYFTVTLSSEQGKDEFLRKYPEATLMNNGELIASSYSTEIYSSVRQPKITILYKAKPVMDVLNRIKMDEDLLVGQDEQVVSEGEAQSMSQRSIIGFRQYTVNPGRNASSSERIVINFKSEYNHEDIKKILMRYPEIDMLNTKIPDKVNMALLSVPNSKEECWAQELRKEPEVESALVNLTGKLSGDR